MRRLESAARADGRIRGARPRDRAQGRPRRVDRIDQCGLRRRRQHPQRRPRAARRAVGRSHPTGAAVLDARGPARPRLFWLARLLCPASGFLDRAELDLRLRHPAAAGDARPPRRLPRAPSEPARVRRDRGSASLTASPIPAVAAGPGPRRASANRPLGSVPATRIEPRHVLASGSLPPGFPWTEIDGMPYWDGGLVDNTPLGTAIDAFST